MILCCEPSPPHPTLNPLQRLRGMLGVYCQLERRYPAVLVGNACRVHFHISLWLEVLTPSVQELRVVFPFHIHEIQYKCVLTVPALQVFLF